MIQANELRVGNLVQWGEKIVPIKSIHIESVLKNEVMVYVEINEKLPHYCLYIAEINPIPLTEEWLVKLGAISNSYQDRYEFDVIHIECNKTRGVTELWIERMPHIKYIHQLQNLYFALTGQELPIKN